MVYGVWCMVYGVWCMVYGVWCMVYGVWCMVYGVWCMVYGVWCMVYGVWCMVYGVWYGVWCMVYGVWCMVYGVWCMVLACVTYFGAVLKFLRVELGYLQFCCAFHCACRGTVKRALRLSYPTLSPLMVLFLPCTAQICPGTFPHFSSNISSDSVLFYVRQGHHQI